MKRLLPLLISLLSATAFAQDWNYRSPQGPYQWGNMPGNEMCGAGRAQSPLDIESGKVAGIINTTPDGSLEALSPLWLTSASHVQYNGHTIQVNYDAGSEVTFEGKKYDLKQFHFHSPSEHILDGRQYPLEMHFVHQSAAGTLVIGVFFEEGEENPALAGIWSKAPREETTVNTPGLMVNALDFLPSHLSYYHYQGSLTTPPCTEGVTWIVLKHSIQASSEELRFLQKHLGGPNNRPIQPQDGRMIGAEGI